MTTWKTYSVWRKHTADGGSTGWIKTAMTIKARTDGEAELKLHRKFAMAGFSAMSLVTVPPGMTINQKAA